MIQRKVFPRQQAPNESIMNKVASANVGESPMADSQAMAEQLKGQQMANAVTDTSKMAKGAEALMPKVPNTMGGMG